jgi:hypothetical protein
LAAELERRHSSSARGVDGSKGSGSSPPACPENTKMNKKIKKNKVTEIVITSARMFLFSFLFLFFFQFCVPV